MTNENTNIVENFQQNEVQTADVQVDQQPEVIAQSVSSRNEKMISLEEANRMARGARLKAKKEALEEIERNNKSSGNLYKSDEEIQSYIKKGVAEEVQNLLKDAEQKEYEAIAQKISNDLRQKIETGKAKYPDFEKNVAEINIPMVANAAPDVIKAISELDNADDVLYELSNHPEKVDILMGMCRRSPSAAIRKVKELSENLKPKAMNYNKVSKPLSQITPSNLRTDNANMSISERRRYFLENGIGI